MSLGLLTLLRHSLAARQGTKIGKCIHIKHNLLQTYERRSHNCRNRDNGRRVCHDRPLGDRPDQSSFRSRLLVSTTIIHSLVPFISKLPLDSV
ncbi:hypothetical protein BKA93DRAFT_216483 [Sparassis latifolia]